MTVHFSHCDTRFKQIVNQSSSHLDEATNASQMAENSNLINLNHAQKGLEQYPMQNGRVTSLKI